MKWSSIVLILASILFAKDITWSPDKMLGEPFRMHEFEAGNFHATLVDYPFDLAKDSVTLRIPKAVVLYIHGFNDYFFQQELAQKIDSVGYSFYAIDLHKYGRSYREGEKMGELRDISEYYAELDSAISMIRDLEGDSVPLVLLGHSTGGLIACLYAADRENGAGISAIVLNSPFLEMNYVWPVRRLAVPVLSAFGNVVPGLGIPRGENLNYDKSLRKSEFGEWDYDGNLKVPGSLDIDFGWLHAIHSGHARVQEGLRLTPPVLVMHSGCSYRDDDWSEEYTYCDGVLDVVHIREYGRNLGPSVELEEIQGGLHDLFLSRKPVRDSAYHKMFKFLESRL